MRLLLQDGRAEPTAIRNSTLNAMIRVHRRCGVSENVGLCTPNIDTLNLITAIYAHI